MSPRQNARVIAVVNQKGGVGKTTTAVSVSAAMAQSGRRVLLVDCDPQGNATSGLGVDKNAIEASLYDVLVDGSTMHSVVLSNLAGVAGLDLVPANLDLSGAEMVLYTDRALSRESVLKSAIRSVASDYDFIVLDGPPSLGLLSINVLTAAERLVIPIQAEYYALEGISQLLQVVERIQKSWNPALEIGLVVLTMLDIRTNLAQQVAEEVRGHFGDRVARTVVPRNIRLSEAPSFGQPITIYDPKSRGAAAYKELAKEVMVLS
jgi:chromosome partitioning protein